MSSGRFGRGFTLVELLLAASLACLLLASSWGWLWTTASLARSGVGEGGSLTASAFAERMLRADVKHSLRLATPSEGVCSASRLGLSDVDPASGVTTSISVAWDPGRGVVWRNASGSYLAEHVAAFVVRYFDGTGDEVEPGSGGLLDAAARETVRVVRVEMTLREAAGERHVVVTETIGGCEP